MSEAASSRFYVGAIVGEFKLLGRVRPNPKLHANLKIRWRVECSCGAKLTVPEFYMKRKGNPKTHCGCKDKTSKTIYNQEYRIWCMMHQRCYFPHHTAYKHYGGRGIKICDRWNRDVSGDDGFENFLADVGPRPSMKFSIDRINVDGDYAPDNVRWATAKEQAQNTRRAKNKA